MNKNMTKLPFRFEDMIKPLQTQENKERIHFLLKWHAQLSSYQSLWNRHKILNDSISASKIHRKVNELFDMEDRINETLSIMYIDTPDPSKEQNNWDGGQTKSKLTERIKTINDLRAYIDTGYNEALQNSASMNNEPEDNNSNIVKSQPTTVTDEQGSNEVNDGNIEDISIENLALDTTEQPSEDAVDVVFEAPPPSLSSPISNMTNNNNPTGQPTTEYTSSTRKTICDFDELFED